MSFPHLNHVAEAESVGLGIVAPDGRDGMLKHTRDFAANKIPFIFDPGQGLSMFTGDDLMEFMSLAEYACFNDYEARMLCERTGRTLEQLAEKVAALIVTRGSEGSQIYVPGQRLETPCVEADSVVDPTGCGDAYRAGLLFGISNGWDWMRTGRLASVMGAIKITHRDGQNHRPSRDDIADRYAKAFGEMPW